MYNNNHYIRMFSAIQCVMWT